MSREEKKREASIPVQARVNIMSLANLESYWDGEGYQIRTMSQLIGNSIDLLCEILRANQKIVNEIVTVAEANKHLEKRDLYQVSMKERSFKKLGKAIMFENMRAEGDDPKDVAQRLYHIMHRGPDEQGNASTVEPFTGRVDSEKIKQGVDIANEISDEELMKRIAERESESRRKGIGEENVVKTENASEVVRKRQLSELPPLKERKNSREAIEAHMRKADAESMELMEELKNLDINELMKSAIKE